MQSLFNAFTDNFHQTIQDSLTLYSWNLIVLALGWAFDLDFLRHLELEECSLKLVTTGLLIDTLLDVWLKAVPLMIGAAALEATATTEEVVFGAAMANALPLPIRIEWTVEGEVRRLVTGDETIYETVVDGSDEATKVVAGDISLGASKVIKPLKDWSVAVINGEDALSELLSSSLVKTKRGGGCFITSPSLVFLKGIWPSLTACSNGSTVCRILPLISSRGPGLWDNLSLRSSASLAFFSCRCFSWRLGSTVVSSKMCCSISSCRCGRLWILCFKRSPVFARSNFCLCWWKPGDVRRAFQRRDRTICQKREAKA